MAHLTEHDIYLVFDRFYDYSIKGVTRAERTKNVAFAHTLSLKTLSLIQLIHLIAKYIISDIMKAFNCNGCSSLKLISDDMDVFVLLAFLYLQQNCKVPIFLESNHGSRTVVDIAATVNKWPQIIPMLPAIHGLTGCDNTSRVFGIEKKAALNICATKSLMELGNKVESMEEIIAEAADFIGFCYGIQNGLSMTEKR